MSWIIFVHILLTFTYCKYSTDAAPAQWNKNRNNILLQHAVKTLMGFKDLPKRDSGVISNPYDGKLIPKYMLDLYEKYRDRNVPTGNAMANTVRSINSEIGLVEGESMFIFNFSSIDSTEKILNSEIHVYKKKRRLNPDVTVTLYELAPNYMTELGKYRLNGGRFGWQVSPVTEAVKSCLSARRAAPHLLALSFSKSSKAVGSASKTFHLKGYVRHFSKPFLVVYSNSDTNLTQDHVHPRLKPNDFMGTFINPESGKRESYGKQPQRSKPKQQTAPVHKGNKQKVEVKDTTSTTTSSPKTTTQVYSRDAERRAYKQEILRRKMQQERKTNDARISKRSIYDNEIPEDPKEPLVPGKRKPSSDKSSSNETPKGNIFQQKLSKKSKINKNRQNTFKMSDFDIKDNKYIKSQYLPFTKDYDSRKKRRRKTQQAKKLAHKSSSNPSSSNKNLQSEDNLELPPPEEWDFDFSSFDSLSPSSGSNSKQKSSNNNFKNCKKRKSMLDFTDIGWNDWIIAPKSFESNFCAGGCNFPHAQNINGLTNHATLQSLAHAVGINKNIPALCCVPGRMTSLSVLYFDQNKNVVLKNYPKMKVETCECH